MPVRAPRVVNRHASIVTLITVRNLWKVFGKAPRKALPALARGENVPGHLAAVRDVSFEVGPGETFVVMGLSGSGKSTLLRCIARLIEPTAGEVELDGVSLPGMNHRQLRALRRHKISMVFQNFGLLPHRKVLDNVSFGLEVRGEAKPQRVARAMQMIELVGLKGWEAHKPAQLSGGMQQRVGLARALAVDPELMLYDEPFSALDPLIRSEMQDELLRLQGQLKKTSIFITHDFSEALKLGDRIAIMKDGAFVQVGTPDQLVSNPANDYVRAFVKDAPRHKVLTAASAMQPLTGAATGKTVSSDTVLENVIEHVAGTDAPVAVVDATGAAIGQIDRASTLKALVPKVNDR